MNRDEALRKIKKCLAVARDKNADANIAAAAMRQAQALMAQHQLSNQDVSLADVVQHASKARTAARARWETWLASAIADAFGCGFIWVKTLERIGHRRLRRNEVVFVGMGEAPVVAGYAWDVLARQCAKARLAHIRAQPGRCKPVTLTARGDVFAEGWVASVLELIDRFAAPESNKLLIQQYISATWPDATDVKPKAPAKGRNVSHDDFRRGMRAGERAELNRGLGAALAPELLA